MADDRSKHEAMNSGMADKATSMSADRGREYTVIAGFLAVVILVGALGMLMTGERNPKVADPVPAAPVIETVLTNDSAADAPVDKVTGMRTNRPVAEEPARASVPDAQRYVPTAPPTAPEPSRPPAAPAPADDFRPADPGVPTAVACHDTDGGQDYFTKGTVTGVNRCIYEHMTQDCVQGVEAEDDACGPVGYSTEGTLFEAFCGPDGRITIWSFRCPLGCADGACLPSPQR